MGEHSAVVWNSVYRRPSLASRSMVAVGTGPPNVLLAPKPTSSVRMSRIFGAPLGALPVLLDRATDVSFEGLLGSGQHILRPCR